MWKMQSPTAPNVCLLTLPVNSLLPSYTAVPYNIIPLFLCLDRGCQFDKKHLPRATEDCDQTNCCGARIPRQTAQQSSLPCHCRQDLWHPVFPLPAVSQVLLQISTQVSFTMFLLHPRREGKGALILVWGKETSATHYRGNSSVHDKENVRIGLKRSGFPRPFPEQRTINLPGQVQPLAVSDQQIMEWEETWLV